MNFKSKVAIIGSQSFLATYIINAFKKKTSLSLTGFSRVKNDLNIDKHILFSFPQVDLDFEKLLDFDTIIYTVGRGIQQKTGESIESIYSVNAFLPIKILNFLFSKKFNGQFITFGSYFEIGYNNEYHFYSEDEVVLSANKVPNDYAASKRLLTCFISSRDLNLKHYHLILPNIYGCGENENRIIPYLINSILKELPVKLTSGEQIRQYIHTSDVANLVVSIVQNDYQSGIYNITQEQPLKIKDLVGKVYQCLGQSASEDIFGHTQRSDAPMNVLLLSGKKARFVLKIKNEITLEEGILSYL